ncbi:MAG: SDR family oxidoreductase [Rhodospirillales bacterium]|nr:MAG: SDR family oxidoreductase [Rhodospirillales bacterium]
MAGGGAIYPDLEGRVVLVTGGGSGIGAAIVRGFARQRAKIGFIDIAEAPSSALAGELSAAGGTVRYVKADLTDIAALRAAVAELRAALGPVSVLVNNAAHDDRHATEDVTPEYFDGRIAVNLKHQFFAAQAVLPDMKAAGGGAIVNFSSISWMTGQGGMAVYTAAKSAVVGLTRSLARDYGKFNIRANAISPGWVRTERQRTLWITPEAEARQMEAQCLKRWLMPDDLAKFTVFLASEEAAACTGQLYVVDGGRV